MGRLGGPTPRGGLPGRGERTLTFGLNPVIFGLMMTSGAGLVAHSGGPTAVINASLLGVVEEARRHAAFGSLYGTRFGIAGILRGEFFDLFAQPDATLRAVAEAPGSALGTSRMEVGTGELERALTAMRARDIRYFFYTGGNGSMGTACQMEHMAREIGYELHVIGIPKTIDNDLIATDHTPGYPSTARFFAAAARDIGADNQALPQVEFVEVLGRDTGWVVAATALARNEPDDAPHLIYLPERPLPLDQLLDDVERVFRRLGRCVVAVCEGQLDERGEPFGADVRVASRGTVPSNLGHRLATLVEERLKIRARSEKPGVLGRSSCAERPRLDWTEAKMCGEAAVRAACAGVSGQMITIVRQPGPVYESTTGVAPLEQVAFVVRAFPEEWRSPAGNDVMPAFLDYILPLTGAVPGHARLSG
jgi:ATP-dependent phosphofructokinase / diphosphate-dependent phosphofructokinase